MYYPKIRKLIAENINILVRNGKCMICKKQLANMRLSNIVNHFVEEHYDRIDDIVAYITIKLVFS